MNILLSIFGLILILILVIVLYPVKYALKWHHEQDKKHYCEFRLILFSGLFGVKLQLVGLEKSYRFILLGRKRKIREISFTREKSESEPPKKARKTVSARIKTARNFLRKFTAGEIRSLFRLIAVHTWRWLKPHGYQFNLKYGFDNPATTGQVYGLLWATGTMQFEKVDIRANYLRPELTGSANIYGNLIIGGIFWRTFVIVVVIGKILLWKQFQLSPAFSKSSQ